MHHHQLFSDKSDLYEKARPSYPNALFKYLLALSRDNDSVRKLTAWDCACGNGQAAIDLVRYFDHVIATDVSDSQIANAKHHPRIDYSVGRSEDSDLGSASVDLVCVAQALHWFDFPAFWPEVRRVLKSGGFFSAIGYNLPRVSPWFDEFIQTTVLDRVEPYWAPHNRLLWNEYRDVDFPFTQKETPNFEMNVDWNLDELFDFFHTFSAVRRYADVHGQDDLSRAYDDAKTRWGQPHRKQTVVFDMVLYVGVKD